MDVVDGLGYTTRGAEYSIVDLEEAKDVRKFSTRFECFFTSSQLVSSVVSHLLHSFRVYFFIVSSCC